MNTSVALFAGIGGFELALERHGHNPALFCEIDQAAQSVLARWRPLTPIHPDIRTLADLPRDASLVACGFPCTDLSFAGLKEGIDGAKSGLVREVFRLRERRRIETVIIENVKGMLSLNGGEAMEVVCLALERLGYRWAYRLVDSRHFGVPQRRERLFFVASLTHDPREILLADDAGTRPQAKPSEVDITCDDVGFYWHEGRGGWGMCVNGVPPLRAGGHIPTPPAIMLAWLLVHGGCGFLPGALGCGRGERGST